MTIWIILWCPNGMRNRALWTLSEGGSSSVCWGQRKRSAINAVQDSWHRWIRNDNRTRLSNQLWRQHREGGGMLVIAALRRALGARPIQEAVRLFRQLMGLRDMRRQPGESMRKWTSRFEAFIKKTGKALHQADAEIDESTFLHPLIQGILLLECSNLSLAENAAVLATSEATTKEGGSIGNSYLYVDLAASFIAQWDDEALMRRDKAPQTHCRCSNHDVGFVFPVELFFWNQTLWMVVNWKWHLALVMNLGRTRAGKSQKRLNFQMMTGQTNSPTRRPQNWKINLVLWRQQRPML